MREENIGWGRQPVNIITPHLRGTDKNHNNGDLRANIPSSIQMKIVSLVLRNSAGSWLCSLLPTGKTSELSFVLSKQTDNGIGCLLGEGFIFSPKISSRAVLKGMIVLFRLVLGI